MCRGLSGVIRTGVLRRPMLEAKLNESATHHLRPLEVPAGTDATAGLATPIQVYDFQSTAAYEDARKLMQMDSITEEIRCVC